MTFPVLVGRDLPLERSKDMVCQMETQGQGDLAAIFRRNLAISQGLHMVDTLLLALHVWEVLNFDQWEWERITEGLPA